MVDQWLVTMIDDKQTEMIDQKPPVLIIIFKWSIDAFPTAIILRHAWRVYHWCTQTMIHQPLMGGGFQDPENNRCRDASLWAMSYGLSAMHTCFRSNSTTFGCSRNSRPRLTYHLNPNMLCDIHRFMSRSSLIPVNMLYRDHHATKVHH